MFYCILFKYLFIYSMELKQEYCWRHTGPILHHRQVVFTCCWDFEKKENKMWFLKHSTVSALWYGVEQRPMCLINITSGKPFSYVITCKPFTYVVMSPVSPTPGRFWVIFLKVGHTQNWLKASLCVAFGPPLGFYGKFSLPSGFYGAFGPPMGRVWPSVEFLGTAWFSIMNPCAPVHPRVPSSQ